MTHPTYRGVFPVAPTVFENTKPDMKIITEEIFARGLRAAL